MSTLEQPKLVELAQEMDRWCEDRGARLHDVALAFGLRHEQVSTSPIGMKSPEEVDQVCDAVIASKTLFDDAFWEDFSDAFDGKVSALERKDHWYYDKVTSKIA